MSEALQADEKPGKAGFNLPTRDRSRKRFLVVFACVLLLCLIVSAAIVYRREQHYLTQAQHALDQLDWDKAALDLDHYLKLWPKDAKAQMLAAQTARRRGRRLEAENHLHTAIQLGGITSDIRLEQALQHAQEGELAEVESLLRAKIEAKDPQSILILEALARGYLSTLRMAQSLKALNMLLERKPDHYHALIWRGRAWEVGSQTEKALKDYEQALVVYPNSMEARMGLAAALYRLGHAREAAGQYDYLCRIRPEDGELAVGKARSWLNLHEIDKAREILEEVLQRQPDLVAALVERGRIAIRTGEASSAETWLRRAVMAAPGDVDAHALLARCLELQGKDEEAARVQDRAGELNTFTAREDNLMSKIADEPQDPEPRYQLGMLLLKAGREEEGQRWLRSARK
jgi:tetratricopeptide (TPR) repeat protein